MNLTEDELNKKLWLITNCIVSKIIEANQDCEVYPTNKESVSEAEDEWFDYIKNILTDK